MLATLQLYFALLARSRLSLLGAVMTTAGFLLNGLLVVLNWATSYEYPYLSILAFAILPGVIAGGLTLIALALVLTARQAGGGRLILESLGELVRSSGRQTMTRLALLVLILTMANLMFFGIMSVELFHFTDSTEFCGQLCHEVMSPEFTAYKNSPHSSVPCVDCHIGPGVNWFVKSKLSGTRQLFAVALHTYSRPIHTPVENLRPARDTCEVCHRPEQFHGNLLKVYQRYSKDERNTRNYTILNLRVGGEIIPDGPPTGIHWHVSPDMTVRYQYADRKRREILRVTMTGPDGNETTWARDDAADTPVAGEQVMDCIDCHNRPTHIYLEAEPALDERMTLREIDAGIPWIKKEALEVLEVNYPSREEADRGLEGLMDRYREERPEVWAEHKEGIEHTVGVLKRIWHANVHPAMGIKWGTYRSNLLHRGENDGCLRCHNKELKTPAGRPINDSCDLCHFVLAKDNADPDVFRCLQIERSVTLW